MSNLTPRGTIKGVIRSGGGGGVTDYDQLTGRPSINNELVTGDKSGHDYGLMNSNDIRITKIVNLTYGTNYDLEFPDDHVYITNQIFQPAGVSSNGTKGLVPRPSAGDTGKILSNEGWIAPPEEYTPPNYSTTEQKTGQKWIDGKDIYSKSGTFPIPSVQGIHTIESNITSYLDRLINVELCLSYADGSYQYSPLYVGTSQAGYISIDTNALVFNSLNEDLGSYTAYYTIYYTKK